MSRARAARAPALGPALSLLALVLLAALAGARGASGGEPPSPAPAAAERSVAAACDGRSDAAAALQAAYDALEAHGGTIVVPAGAVCAIGGSGVVPRSKVALRCDEGARFLALPGAQALFRTTETLDDWSVSGCEFDLNGVAAVAWESSGAEQGGARWTFRDNYVHGMPAGAGAPLATVRIDCTLAAGPCLIARNTIIGSDSAGRRDTCLTVTAGGFIGANTQVIGNYLQGCGGDCLELRRPGGVSASDNVLVRCHDNAVDNSSLNSVWTGNQLATTGAEAGAIMSIHDTIGNQVIVGNQFAVNPRSKAPALHAVAAADAGVAGVYVDANYAAQGVWLDAQGRCAGGTCNGEACDDDGGCASCSGQCGSYGHFDHDHIANLIVTGSIRVENATNLVVQGNVVIGQAGPGPSAQIQITNSRANAPAGGIVVADNQLAKDARPASSLACIELDDAGGGGFSGVTITGNSCGQDPATNPAKPHAGPRPQGIRLPRQPRTFRSVLIANNNFGNAADALVGFEHATVRAGTRLSGNLGLDPGDAGPVRATVVARSARDLVRAESAAAAAEPALALQLEPGRAYAVDGHLRLRAADAHTGVTVGFGVPAAGTLSVVLRAEPGAAGASALLTGADAPPAVFPLAVGDSVLSLSGTVTTAASGGPLELRWAQGTAGPAPLLLQSGSWLRAMELP